MMSEQNLLKDFKADVHKLLQERLSAILMIAIVLVPLFGGLDYIIAPEFFGQFMLYRLITISLCVISLLLNKSKLGSKLVHFQATFFVVNVTTMITAMCLALGGESSSYYAGINLVILATLAILPFGLAEAGFNCLVLYCIYLGGILFFDQDLSNIPTMINNNYFMLSTLLILTVAAYYNQKARFREFKLRRAVDEHGKQLEKYNDDLEIMVEQRTAEKISLEQSLAQVQKMEAVGTLASGIAHDFNNLLGSIMGYASFLKIICPDVPQIQNCIDIIDSSAEKASSVSKQLLSLGRKTDNYAFEPLHLGKIVTDIEELLKMSLANNISLVIEIEENLKTVEADHGQIEQIVMNLVINAGHAMPEGGKIKIRICNHLFKVASGNIPAGEYVGLSVIDNGTGIPKEIQSKIFEPFFTTKAKDKGSGLGLAMVFSIVQNHQGFIQLDSTEGVGTTFNLNFPITNKSVAEISSKKSSGLHEGKGTILVVDDEETLRDMLAKMLKLMGYRVIHAENGQQAYEIYTEKQSEIKLVVLDMMMPELDGEQTFYKLKSFDAQVKVLLASGYGEGDSVQKTIDAGAASFMAKPYRISDVSEKIQQVLAGKK